MRDLIQERDEAREAFAIATSNCVAAQQRLREMERERNEARREAKARADKATPHPSKTQ